MDGSMDVLMIMIEDWGKKGHVCLFLHWINDITAGCTGSLGMVVLACLLSVWIYHDGSSSDVVYALKERHCATDGMYFKQKNHLNNNGKMTIGCSLRDFLSFIRLKSNQVSSHSHFSLRCVDRSSSLAYSRCRQVIHCIQRCLN